MYIIYIYNLFFFLVFFLNSKTLWQKGGVGVCSLVLFSFNLCHILARGGDLTQPSFPQATSGTHPWKTRSVSKFPLFSGHEYLRQKKNMSNCVGGNGAGASTCKYIDYICKYCCCIVIIICMFAFYDVLVLLDMVFYILCEYHYSTILFVWTLYLQIERRSCMWEDPNQTPHSFKTKRG